MLAGSDLSKRVHNWLTYPEPADHSLKLSKRCLIFGAKQVLISEFLPRRHLQLFNSGAEDTNKEIKLLVQGDLRLYYWQHNHNNFSSRFLSDYVHHDGIHVDPIHGMARYFSSCHGFSTILY